MKSWKNLTHHVFFLWLLPFVLGSPHFTRAAEVTFGFNSEVVSLTEGEKIYLFPRKVFEARFGAPELGRKIAIGAEYKGFELTGGNAVKPQSVKGTIEDQLFAYGDLHFQKRGKYWFLAQSNANLDKNGRFPLNAESVKYTWVVPDDSIAERKQFDELQVEKAVRENGTWNLTGKVHSDEGEYSMAVQVKDKFYYIKKDMKSNSVLSGTVGSVEVKSEDILYVAEGF